MSREFYIKIMCRAALPCVLLAAAACLAGCSTERDGYDPADGGARTEVTFSLKLPGAAAPSARGIEAADEDAVLTADVYVFDRETDLLVDIGYGRGITDGSAGDEVIRNFAVTLQTGDNRDVVVLTNARGIVAEAYPGGVPPDGTVDKDAFRAALTATLPAGGWKATGSAEFDPFPMWGERQGVKIEDNTALTGSKSIRITRMVARVNVLLADGLDASKFTLKSVRVYNYNKVGRLVPDEAATDWQDDKPYSQAPSLTPDPGFTVGPLVYPCTDGRSLLREIYIFEARKGLAPSDGDFIENPCVVVGGCFGGSSTETFYRIDIAQKQDDGTVRYLDILRNNSYNITIKDVNGPGKPDEDEAYNSLPVNIDTEIVAWNEHDMNELETDGQYQLTVDKSVFTFFDEGRAQTMKVYTDYPRGWKLEEETLPAWLVGNITPTGDNSGTSVEVTIAPGPISAIDASVATSDTLRYSFWITAGSIRKRINIVHVNEPELTITLSENTLTFRRGAPHPKSVTVTIFPEGLDVYVSAMGEVSWVAGGFPDSPLPLSNPYNFQPAPLADAIQSTINSEITFHVMKDGKIASEKLTIYQLATDILFNASTPQIPYAGGAGQAAGVYFTANSDAVWRVNSYTDPEGLIGSFDNTDNPAGTGVLYEFTANPNPYFRNRTATFHVVSDDEEFTPRDVTITQGYRAPYITLSAPTVNLGSDGNGASGSVTVYSNAEWTWTASANWNSVYASATPATGGSANAAIEAQNGVTFTPRVYGKDANTPAPQTFTATLSLASTNHAPEGQATASLSASRTVPAYFDLTSANTSIARSGGNVAVSVNTNAYWSATPSAGTGTGTQSASAWGAKTANVAIAANTTWSTTTAAVNRTVTVNTAYGTTSALGTAGSSFTVTQPGYFISAATTNHTAAIVGYQATARSVTLTGATPAMTNWIRAVTGSTELATGSIAAGESGARAGTVTIPVNATWAARSVQMQYYHPGTGNWTNVGSAYDQTGYVTTGLSRSGTASGGAFVITVTSTGYQPDLPLRVVTGSTVLASGVNLAAGTTNSRSANITCPANPSTTATRIVYVQAQLNGTWTNIGASFTQPIGHVQLSSGRYVAANDVSGGAMNWATAMGIPQSYNTTSYPQQNVQNYTTGYAVANGGCAAYSEVGYPAGTWRLPTLAEMRDIYAKKTQLGTFDEEHMYWMNNSTNGGITADAFSIRAGTYSTGNRKTYTSPARCVRD